MQQQQHHWYAHPKAAWEDALGAGSNKIAQAITKTDIGWRIGESVAHAKFGEGVIVNIEGILSESTSGTCGGTRT